MNKIIKLDWNKVESFDDLKTIVALTLFKGNILSMETAVVVAEGTLSRDDVISDLEHLLVDK